MRRQRRTTGQMARSAASPVVRVKAPHSGQRADHQLAVKR
jgi:hypothetical protein